MRAMASVSAQALRTLLGRVIKTHESMGQCLECETAGEDMHSTKCRTAAAILEARFALIAAALAPQASRGDGLLRLQE